MQITSSLNSIRTYMLPGADRIFRAMLQHSSSMILTTQVLSNAQHAYLKRKSAESALYAVVGYIERDLEYRKYTLAAFLDIERSFYNIVNRIS